MYCIHCGVKLADTEKKCPLCETEVYHPSLTREEGRPLYPAGKMPKRHSGSKVLSGATVIVFLIPMLISLVSDLQSNGVLEWGGYVVGAMLVAYVTLALPLWFDKPNPVIFVPCDFAAAALYLLYIDLATDGGWFLSFAFPVIGGLALIVCAVVTLLRYIRRGRLYIVGGASVALGGFLLFMEFLMHLTFEMPFIGWSIYPLIVLTLFGCLLIYLAINASAREILERKLFF